LQPERRIITVSDLTARIRELLAKNFTDVTLQGRFRIPPGFVWSLLIYFEG